MKKIKYSVTERTVKWGAHAGEKRYTANLQTTGIMSLDDFAGHMADHDCKYNKGDIYSVLTQAASCVREMLLEGHKVSLGDLGVIAPKIKQYASKTREEFTSSNITDLYAKITIGKALKDMRKDATFENVPTLANQALLMAAEREGANTVSLVKPTSGSSSSSGSENQGGSSSSSGSSGTSSVAAPTISGTTPFDDSTQVTISGPAGSTIKYTTNGVAPTATYGNDYEEPITLNASATVKAVAIIDGVASEVATKAFVKNGSQGGSGEEGM